MGTDSTNEAPRAAPGEPAPRAETAPRGVAALVATFRTAMFWRIAPWMFGIVLAADAVGFLIWPPSRWPAGMGVRLALLSVPALVATVVGMMVLLPTVLIPLERLRADLAANHAADSAATTGLGSTQEAPPSDADELAHVRRLMRALQRAKDRAIDAEKKAVAADRAKSEFLTSVSHELRTPLTAVLGYSELILMACESGDTSAIDIQRLHANAIRIRESGQQLKELIEGLLTYGRTSGGAMEVHLEPANIARIVDVVLGTLQPQADKAGLALTVDVEPDLPLLVVDRGKLRQSLLNVAANAIKFTDQGSVAISARREAPNDGDADDWLVFRVVDTGIGIPPDKLEAVFEPFTQADSSVSRRHGGVGLGLAISRRFCALMGGSIAVDSELGVGSTFTIRVPARTAESWAGSESQQPG